MENGNCGGGRRGVNHACKLKVYDFLISEVGTNFRNRL